jgi:hypothetical protein
MRCHTALATIPATDNTKCGVVGTDEGVMSSSMGPCCMENVCKGTDTFKCSSLEFDRTSEPDILKTKAHAKQQAAYLTLHGIHHVAIKKVEISRRVPKGCSLNHFRLDVLRPNGRCRDYTFMLTQAVYPIRKRHSAQGHLNIYIITIPLQSFL